MKTLAAITTTAFIALSCLSLTGCKSKPKLDDYSVFEGLVTNPQKYYEYERKNCPNLKLDREIIPNCAILHEFSYLYFLNSYEEFRTSRYSMNGYKEAASSYNYLKLKKRYKDTQDLINNGYYDKFR